MGRSSALPTILRCHKVTKLFRVSKKKSIKRQNLSTNGNFKGKKNPHRCEGTLKKESNKSSKEDLCHPISMFNLVYWNVLAAFVIGHRLDQLDHGGCILKSYLDIGIQMHLRQDVVDVFLGEVFG